jgi:hypothetical protein
MNKIKCCPFCGSDKIDYSIKTTGRWERKYHVAMYCKDCNCYGKRVLITPVDNESRFEVERNPKYKQLAINAWNTRSEEIANTVLKGVNKRINWLSEEIGVSRYERRNNLKMMLSEMDCCRRMLEEELQK